MSPSLRVLIPEDSEDDFRLLVRELSKLGYRTRQRRVKDRAAMQGALQEESWDLILCDYSMPRFTALDALALVREQKLDIPFIVISGHAGEEFAVEAMKAGAHDYLTKGKLSRLGEAIERELGQARIRAEHARGVARLEHLNRVLQAVRGINRLIVQEKDPELLLQRSGEHLVATRGYENASFFYTDRGEAAYPFVSVLEEGKPKSVALEPIPLSNLPACLRIAADANHSLILEEDLPDCSGCQFQDLHSGKVRLAGPLVHDGMALGFTVISLPKGSSVKEAERELFDEMVNDIAFALHGLTLAEQELKSQERFQRLYENMAQGVVYQDASGRVTLCNRAAERVLGLSQAQMQGRTSMDPRWESVHEDGSEYPGELHPGTLALRNGTPERGIMGVRNSAEGKRRWLSVSAFPEFDASGSPPVGVFTTFEDITAIRTAEAQLREAQSIAGLGRWELDLRAGSLQWSESIFALFEVDPASFEPSYEAFLDFVHPEDRGALEAAYQQSVESGTRYVLPHRLQMPDGRVKWVKEMGRTHYADDGTPICSVGIVLDVTDLKTAERETRESESRYRSLFENAPVGIFSTTSEGRVLSVNPTMARMLGLPSVEAALERYNDLGEQLYVSSERRAQFVRELHSKGQVTGFEYEARTADNRTIWLSSTARVAERCEDGSFTIEGFANEVTQQKKAELGLARSQALLGLTGKMAKVGGWEFDPSSGETYLSEETLRIYDLPPDSQLPIEAGASYYHPDDRPAVLEAFNRAAEHGEGYDLELRLISSAGNTKWVETIGEPHYEDGKLVKIFGTLQDISERKQREMEKADLESQYAQAQKLESVGRLAGGVAHDFNNQLCAIMGFAGLVADALREGDPLHADLMEVIEAAKRAEALTSKLLAFSRKQMMEAQIISLNDVVMELEKMLARLIGEDVYIKTALPEELPTVCADPGQIEQILMNLAINARDAMPLGGTLTIETVAIDVDEAYVSGHPESELGPHVMLVVSDDGEGMSAEIRSQVFEPFFTTKEKGKGTGLGLATVYGIVKQSGGSISVDSEPGKGTTFRILLPQVEGEKQTDRAVPHVSQIGGNETILIVEDEQSVRALAKRMLQSAGYNVLVAANAGEALLEFENRGDGIDLMLTDVIMPRMSGKALADRLEVLNPSLRILYMSGYTNETVVKHGVLEAGTQFIAKPFNESELRSKVREVLDRA